MVSANERSIVSEHEETDVMTAPDVVESASATTSPDNERSGAGAYLIFALGVGLLVLLVTGLTSCASSLTRVASVALEEDASVYYHDEWGDDLYDLYEDYLLDDGFGDIFYDDGLADA